MVDYIEDLAQTKLFFGIAPKEIAGLLDCIHARCVKYTKDEMIIEEGSKVYEFGIMLSGHGRSIKWDAADKLIIITLLQKAVKFERSSLSRELSYMKRDGLIDYHRSSFRLIP